MLEAAKSNDVKLSGERKCEAFFYAATKRLIDRDVASAKKYFQQCVDTGVSTFTEYMSARAELDAMERGRKWRMHTCTEH